MSYENFRVEKVSAMFDELSAKRAGGCSERVDKHRDRGNFVAAAEKGRGSFRAEIRAELLAEGGIP